MAHVTKDRVADTTSTTGTGPFSMSNSPPTGYRAFGHTDVCDVGDTVYCCIAHRTLDEWIVAKATYGAANQLTISTILDSSNGGSAVTFSAGLKDVILTVPAGFLDELAPDPAVITTLTSVDGAADWIQVYDTSASEWKKALPTDILGASGLTNQIVTQVAGNALRIVNTSDSASVQVAKFEGDRATMADNDEAYLSFLLSNDGGTQTEVARQTWAAPDVNAGTSVDGRIDWAVITAGTLADALSLDGAALYPSSSGLILGIASTNEFGGLRLGSGASIGWNNADVLATHSANALAFTGAASGYSFDNPLSIAAQVATSSKYWSTSAATLTGYISTGLFNHGVGLFAGVNAPYSSDPNVVFNVGYNVAAGGGRENASYPDLKLSFETKYYSAAFVRPTQPHLEWHLSSTDTGGTEHRPISFALPWDGGTGSLGSFAADKFTFYNYANTSQMEFNFRTPSLIEWTCNYQTTIRIASNNTAVLRQLNAAGTDYVDNFYVDSADRLLALAPVAVIAAPDSTLNAVAYVATSSMAADKYLRRGTWDNSVTGTVNADYIAGQATVEALSSLINYGAGHATYKAEAFTADPRIMWTPNGGTSWVAGVDNSDDDAWKIATGTALETNTRLRIDRTTGEIVTGLGGASIPQLTFTPNSGTAYSLGMANGGTTLVAYAGGNQQLGLGAGQFLLPSGGSIRWTNNGSNVVTTQDTGIARAAAALVEINNGTPGTIRDLLLRSLYFNGTAATDVLLKRAGIDVQFRVGDDSAYGNADALAYKASGTKVIGSRVSGWTAASGTAARTTYATFAGQNISAAPTEAEVQAIDDHVVILSQRLKAVIDDLISHGLIGT